MKFIPAIVLSMAVLAAAIPSPAESPKASSPGRPRGPADCSLKTVTDPTSKVVVNRLPKDRRKGKIVCCNDTSCSTAFSNCTGNVQYPEELCCPFNRPDYTWDKHANGCWRTFERIPPTN